MMGKVNKLIQNSKKAKSQNMLSKYLIGRLISENCLKLKLKLKGIHDSAIFERIEVYKEHQNLKKEYQQYFKEKHFEEKSNCSFSKVIWWCWLQGIDEAPLLSKMCLKSIKKFFPEYKINVVTLNNIDEYVEIPDYIIRKYNAGIIKAATFSDILRLMLLDSYGGIWIDSTVLCTNDKIKKIVESNPLFAFKNGILDHNNDIKISSWFLSCEPGNLLIHDTKELMLDYWKDHNYTENYYLMHLFFTLTTEKYPRLWRNVPTFDNVTPHILVTELNDKFSKKRFNQLRELCSVYKLNNHKNYKKDGTLYGFLLNKYEV